MNRNRNRNGIKLAIASVLLLVGCSSGPGSSSDADGGADAAPVPAVASAVIGAAGGHVALADGTSVVIPRGALKSDVTITIELDPNAPAPSAGTRAGDNYLFGPEGQQFDLPVTVTVAIEPSELPEGESAEDVVVYTAPKGSGGDAYLPIAPTVVDADHVSVETTHFSHYTGRALHTGEYVSVAPNRGAAPYLGDWENNGGYVLGYLLRGSRIYAKTVTMNSVYGLVVSGNYGAWDQGHRCAWVSLDKNMKWSGRRETSSVADVCPDAFNDPKFSLAHGQPTGIFKPGSWIESDGLVQPAMILPTCSGADLTVYANYDPATHIFSDPDGEETPGRGFTTAECDVPQYPSAKSGRQHPQYPAPEYSVDWSWNEGAWAWEQVAVTGPLAGLAVAPGDGYCGFGTRFTSADGIAVEIKDTRRNGGHDVTAFGFMHAYCVAGIPGTGIGAPAGPVPCGTVEPGHHVFENGASFESCQHKVSLSLAANGELVETELATGTVTTVLRGTSAGDILDMQTDGNLVLYNFSAGKQGTPVWASKTERHPGARLFLNDSGEIVVYFGKVLWKWDPPTPHATTSTARCCAKCSTLPTEYYAGELPGESCANLARVFCAEAGGTVTSSTMGTCADEP